jgi:hypothetical protein
MRDERDALTDDDDFVPFETLCDSFFSSFLVSFTIFALADDW